MCFDGANCPGDGHAGIVASFIVSQEPIERMSLSAVPQSNSSSLRDFNLAFPPDNPLERFHGIGQREAFARAIQPNYFGVMTRRIEVGSLHQVCREQVF